MLFCFELATGVLSEGSLAGGFGFVFCAAPREPPCHAIDYLVEQLSTD